MRRLHLLGAALVLAATTGCGTLANVQSKEYILLAPPIRPSAPFGGVTLDVQRIGEGPVGGQVFYLIDLPFSLVGDVVTLPVVGYQMWERSREQAPPAAVAPLPTSAPPGN